MFGSVNVQGESVKPVLAAIDELRSELVAGDISAVLATQDGEILATQDGEEILAHRILAM